MNQNAVFLTGATVWAWHPARKEHEAGYTLFRRVVHCVCEDEYHVAVSADNRFNFYLDGQLLGRGPVRSNLEHYFYDEYSGTLAPGTHIFAAEVVVWGDAWRHSAAPWAEIHVGGGFLVAGYAGDERLELPSGWLASIDVGRRALSWKETWQGKSMIPAPPMDEVDFNHFDVAWATSSKPAGQWEPLVSLGRAVFRNEYQTDPPTPWILEARQIRQMTQTFTPFTTLLSPNENFRLVDGRLCGSCSAGKHRLLLDIGRNQTSMICFSGQGGRGTCRIAYAETLFDEKGFRTKSLPGSIGELGYADRLIMPDTGTDWRYRSFWYRTGRFIELELDLDAPLYNLELEIEFVTYPFGDWKEFHAPDDPMLERIYEVACHTVQCCAHEHFEDCPYYEQLQYAGDTRIQALISYAATENDSLGRQALLAFAHSQLSCGLTQSRFPSTFRQIIPGFSLIWALMVHDHFQLFGDSELVRELLPGMERMLDAFERNRLDNGLIGSLEGWHFTDWTRDWPAGASDRGNNVPETILNLFYTEACRRIAEMKNQLGLDGAELLRRAETTLKAVKTHCFDQARNRYRDVPGQDWFSVHVNVLAVLFGALPEADRALFLREILFDSKLTQATLYFEFYILSALQRYGTPLELRQRLKLWEKMLDMGFTTFPEIPSLSLRSECHAWSSSPAWFLLGGETVKSIHQY